MKLAVLALALAACSGGSSHSMDMGKGGPQMCVADGKTVQLAPQYAVQALLEVHVNAQGIVDTDVEGELLLLAQMNQSGTMAQVTAQPCKIKIPPVPLKGGNMPVTLTVSPTLIKSVQPVMSTATLSSQMTCGNFTGTPITLAIGAHLANVASDPLPPFVANNGTKLCGGMASTKCNPPPSDTGCVCDQEGDGILGATLDAMNIPGYDDVHKLYVDLRTQVTLAGQVFPPASGQSAPRLVGTIQNLKLEQQVLGCEHVPAAPGTPTPCTNTDSQGGGGEVQLVGAFNPTITQSANTPSPFTAVPVDTSATCDTIVAMESTLFGG